jgi:hypothetical protein
MVKPQLMAACGTPRARYPSCGRIKGKCEGQNFPWTRVTRIFQKGAFTEILSERVLVPLEGDPILPQEFR